MNTSYFEHYLNLFLFETHSEPTQLTGYSLGFQTQSSATLQKEKRKKNHCLFNSNIQKNKHLFYQLTENPRIFRCRQHLQVHNVQFLSAVCLSLSNTICCHHVELTILLNRRKAQPTLTLIVATVIGRLHWWALRCKSVTKLQLSYSSILCVNYRSTIKYLSVFNTDTLVAPHFLDFFKKR